VASVTAVEVETWDTSKISDNIKVEVKTVNTECLWVTIEMEDIKKIWAHNLIVVELVMVEVRPETVSQTLTTTFIITEGVLISEAIPTVNMEMELEDLVLESSNLMDIKAPLPKLKVITVVAIVTVDLSEPWISDMIAWARDIQAVTLKVVLLLDMGNMITITTAIIISIIIMNLEEAKTLLHILILTIENLSIRAICKLLAVNLQLVLQFKLATETPVYKITHLTINHHQARAIEILACNQKDQ
jgi:hypothetical protein